MQLPKLNSRLLILLCLLLITSCEKVSLSGVLLGNSSVNDRVEMSYMYYASLAEENNDIDALYKFLITDPEQEEYTFLVGADSHMTTDTSRLQEMMDIALRDGDLFCAHLGDIADTRPEYYAALNKLLNAETSKYLAHEGILYNEETQQYYRTDKDGAQQPIPDNIISKIRFPLYVTVGNHDITHNGWSMFQDIFKTSFFQVYVFLQDGYADRYIFIDSANGTLGDYQVDLLDNDMLMNQTNVKVRNTFTFTHSNIFRPSTVEFASTYPREELYYLLNKFTHWNVDIAFFGHVHAWDERDFAGVKCLTLDSMSERNSPEPGDYLVRVHVRKDGSWYYEKVRMTSTAGHPANISN